MASTQITTAGRSDALPPDVWTSDRDCNRVFPHHVQIQARHNTAVSGYTGCRQPALRRNPSGVQAVGELLAGRNRSAEFELALDNWAAFGLSRFSAYRGLDTLEQAGLVLQSAGRDGLRP
jgi:hypothetical protein